MKVYWIVAALVGCGSASGKRPGPEIVPCPPGTSLVWEDAFGHRAPVGPDTNSVIDANGWSWLVDPVMGHTTEWPGDGTGRWAGWSFPFFATRAECLGSVEGASALPVTLAAPGRVYRFWGARAPRDHAVKYEAVPVSVEPRTWWQPKETDCVEVDLPAQQFYAGADLVLVDRERTIPTFVGPMEQVCR